MRRDGAGDDADFDDGDVTELFGAENFREYDDANPFVAPSHGSTRASVGGTVSVPLAPAPSMSAPLRSDGALSAAAGSDGSAPVAPQKSAQPTVPARIGGWWASRTRAQKQIVAGAAAGAVLVLVLVGMFAIGSGIGRGLGPDAAASDTVPEAVGPGVYAWSALQGGECIEPFDTVWADEFTVVECGQPHSAQLLYRGEVGPEVTVYLDAEGWQGLTSTLCDAETLLDFDAAAELSDLTWQISYAGDVTEWANGDRGYSCFITRSSGDPLEGSLLAAP